MIIVLFEVTIKQDCMDQYLSLAGKLKESLIHAEGFIRAERFSSFVNERKFLSLSVWKSEEAVEKWRNQEEHRFSQRQGRDALFESYAITIASLLRIYTDNERREAPKIPIKLSDLSNDMKKMLLQTDRLILRPWNDEDRQPFAAMNADPEVMRYLLKILNEKESDELVDRFRQEYDRRGYAMMAVQRIEDGRFLGFTGIGHHRWFPDEVEIGWRLARSAWGQGYATEAAETCAEYAFDTLGFDHLIAITLPENVRSQAVMERLGMHEDRRVTKEEVDLVIYRLDRKQ